MDNSVWLALAVCAVGTFLLRVIPMLWMKRHLIRQSAAAAEAPMPVWLTVLAPTMIAAMFGVSLVPGSLTFSAWLATALGILTTLLVWRRTRSLGWPVCAGVLMFGVVEVVAVLIAGN
jgi:branched-subunit amino acid transport protein AzlD